MDQILIYEVGPRDGLQNEPELIKAEDKIALVDLLSETGLKKIETSSFVSPKWVPQMVDAHEVFKGIKKRPGVIYSALTPNLRGFEDALKAKVDEVAIFGSASEGFSAKNINCTIEESFQRFEPVIKAALANHIPVRGYISCVIECPYDGAIAPKGVREIAKRMLEMGCYEISLGDTIGVGTPETIEQMLGEVLKDIPAQNLAGHYHDTNGRALDNIVKSAEMGLRCFDAAVGGLGGCPYAPGSAGNVATEDVVLTLHNLDYDTGVDMPKLQRAVKFAKSLRS